MQRVLASSGRTLVEPRGAAYVFAALVLGSLAIAVSAQLAIDVPLSPVPITGQTFAVLLIGAAYGSRLGALTVLTHVAQGAAGAPVFANGTGGWIILEGPTGGYIVGWIAAAFVVGWLAERGWGRNPFTTAAVMVLGNVVIYIFGVAWLQKFTGFDAVWELGVRPFLAGDLVKLLLAAGVLPGAWWLRERLGNLGASTPAR